MDILGFTQEICPNQQLSQWQKDILLNYQKAKEENKILFVQPGRNIGRTMIVKIIKEYEKNETNRISRTKSSI